MTIQRPLFWHQGLFLQPQHFQLQEQALRSCLAPLLIHQTPHFWGVGALEIDEAAIGTGTFSILSGSFLFQDGTYVECPGNAVIPPRSFEGKLTEGKPLQAYLGLKRLDRAGQNVAVIEDVEDAVHASTRFVAPSVPDTVTDLHGGGPDGQVRQLYHLLRFFWDGEEDLSAGYHLIPLAQVENFNGYQLSRKFVPPSLGIGAIERLRKLVHEIRDLVAARCRHLEQYKKQRGVHNAEFGSRDMVYLLALLILSRHLPLLSHFAEAGAVHPWPVYGALRTLIGELSSFSLTIDATDQGSNVPRYEHRNLWGCFSAARDLIVVLLDEITAGADYVVRLVNDGNSFSADLKPAHVQIGNRYFLALKTEQDLHLVRQSLDAVAKLASREQLPVLIAHALPGARLQHLPIPPQELPRRSQTAYFAIDHHHSQWETVIKEHNIAMQWDNAPADLEVELLILEKAASSP